MSWLPGHMQVSYQMFLTAWAQACMSTIQTRKPRWQHACLSPGTLAIPHRKIHTPQKDSQPPPPSPSANPHPLLPQPSSWRGGVGTGTDSNKGAKVASETWVVWSFKMKNTHYLL